VRPSNEASFRFEGIGPVRLASPIFTVIVVLCACSDLSANTAPSPIPVWLKKHVGEGEDQIAGPVFERARALYFRKTAEGEIRNPCYFAMDATRPHALSDGRLGKRFYIICEAARSFHAIPAGHGGGRDLLGVADFKWKTLHQELQLGLDVERCRSIFHHDNDGVRVGGRPTCATVHKNRNRFPTIIDIPILAPLQTAIDATDASGRLVFVVTSHGKPFSIAGFGNWFHDRCVEAGLPHCSAHGLRKAGSTRAAEAGATAHQLMAMFGWRSLAEAERYTRAAERKRMAEIGMGKLLEGVDAGKSVPLSRPVLDGGTNRRKNSTKSDRKK